MGNFGCFEPGAAAHETGIAVIRAAARLWKLPYGLWLEVGLIGHSTFLAEMTANG